MSYLILPAVARAGFVPPCQARRPRRAGRFAETRKVRALRGVFRMLCKVAPAVAAHIGYAMLAKPPASAENTWQVALRGKALTWRLGVGAGQIAVYEWGAGPAILLVHGWGSRATHMGKLVGPLVAAGFRVVAFDAPAHGASTGGSTDLVEFASAVAAVARQVGPLRCVLAHSFGASMSLYAQRDWGLATDKLVLISSFEHCVWFTEAFGECMGLSSSVLEEVRQKLVERHCGRLNWSRLSVLDMLRDSQGQALVIHDEDDAEIPFEHGLALARVSPRTEFLATRGYGHHRVLRRNDVIQRIVQFISA